MEYFNIKTKSVEEQEAIGGVRFVPEKVIKVFDGSLMSRPEYYVAHPGIFINKTYATVVKEEE